MVFLTVFGHTNIDYLATVARLPGPDESMAFEGPVRALGGTAANIAVAAAALGTPVALASFVGDDFPPAFERALKRRGVDTRALVRLPNARTPVCWVFTDKRERQVAFINQGAAAQGGRRPVNRSAVEAASVVHLATGPPRHHLKAAALASSLGRSVSFDPGQELAYLWTPGSFRQILRTVDTLFLNDAERRQAMKYLHVGTDRGLLGHVDALVLTHGARGSEYLSRTEHVRAPAVRARRVVNTTGAGDAFRGGYYAAAYGGQSARARLLWGAAAASFAVESHGGQESLPTQSQLVRRLAPLRGLLD